MFMTLYICTCTVKIKQNLTRYGKKMLAAYAREGQIAEKGRWVTCTKVNWPNDHHSVSQK